MTKETYETLVDRCYYLCKKYKLNSNNIWLHKEVVGWKSCHKWFVDNPIEWTKFKNKVQYKLDYNKNIIIDVIHKEVIKLFKDIDSVSEYAKSSVIELNNKGILKGDNDGNINPKNNITMEQLAIVIDRTIKYLEDKK
jgi:uncharacterized protein YeaO (DUF488 family)